MGYGKYSGCQWGIVNTQEQGLVGPIWTGIPLNDIVGASFSCSSHSPLSQALDGKKVEVDCLGLKAIELSGMGKIKSQVVTCRRIKGERR